MIRLPDPPVNRRDRDMIPYQLRVTFSRTRMPTPNKLLTTLCCLTLAWLPGCGSEDSTQPGSSSDQGTGNPAQHVLLIVIDTLRADHLSCYGYWRVTSPNIDAMAERGVRFTRAIAQSSWTAPSMVTLMTGQRLSGPRLAMPIEKPALAELFKDAGYKTGAWVANDLLNHDMGFDRGFDHFIGSLEWHNQEPSGKLDDIVAWLKDNKDRKTFTWVHFTDPHDPYIPAADLRTGIPGRISEYQADIIANAAGQQELSDSIVTQTASIATDVGNYDDEVTTVDRKVRQLLLAMQEAGTLDNAIIALTSDHGECLWERPESDRRFSLKANKRKTPTTIKHLLKQTHGDFVYQELIRVPLIVMAPGLEKGLIEDTVVESVHLPITLLRLAGVDVDGVDQLMGANMFGEQVPPGAYAMTSLGESFISESGWKLILPTASGAKEYGQVLQLFDLNKDPGELVNLARQFPERVEAMTTRLVARSQEALPKLNLEELNEAAERNAAALEALGYTKGGIMDPNAEPAEQEGDEHP
jgi:arylsulfatase A-like enzyme